MSGLGFVENKYPPRHSLPAGILCWETLEPSSKGKQHFIFIFLLDLLWAFSSYSLLLLGPCSVKIACKEVCLAWQQSRREHSICLQVYEKLFLGK